MCEKRVVTRVNRVNHSHWFLADAAVTMLFDYSSFVVILVSRNSFKNRINPNLKMGC